MFWASLIISIIFGVMSNCEKSCMLCQNDQSIKVNFTLVHGLCAGHPVYNEEFLECVHCECVVPVSFITYLYTEYQYSCANTSAGTLYQKELGSYSDSMNLNTAVSRNIESCEYCAEEKELSALDCAHRLCLDCACDGCKLCVILDSYECIPNSVCEFCGLKAVKTESGCGHKLCDECGKKNCELCSIPSRTQSIFDTKHKMCDFCLNAPSITSCSQSHNLCTNCLTSNCPLCYSFPPITSICEACGIHADLSQCSNNHKLCKSCLSSCSICQSLTFTSNNAYSPPAYTAPKIEKNNDSTIKSGQLTRSIEAVQKCEFCRKNQGHKGNFCSHMICKDCIYEHKKVCEEDYKSSFNDTASLLSIPDNVDDAKRSLVIEHKDSRKSSGYQLNKELERTQDPVKLNRSAPKQCKCQVF